jgi:hypothetical protein
VAARAADHCYSLSVAQIWQERRWTYCRARLRRIAGRQYSLPSPREPSRCTRKSGPAQTQSGPHRCGNQQQHTENARPGLHHGKSPLRLTTCCGNRPAHSGSSRGSGTFGQLLMELNSPVVDLYCFLAPLGAFQKVVGRVKRSEITSFPSRKSAKLFKRPTIWSQRDVFMTHSFFLAFLPSFPLLRVDKALLHNRRA